MTNKTTPRELAAADLDQVSAAGREISSPDVSEVVISKMNATRSGDLTDLNNVRNNFGAAGG